MTLSLSLLKYLTYLFIHDVQDPIFFPSLLSSRVTGGLWRRQQSEVGRQTQPVYIYIYIYIPTEKSPKQAIRPFSQCQMDGEVSRSRSVRSLPELEMCTLWTDGSPGSRVVCLGNACRADGSVTEK